MQQAAGLDLKQHFALPDGGHSQVQKRTLDPCSQTGSVPGITVESFDVVDQPPITATVEGISTPSSTQSSLPVSVDNGSSAFDPGGHYAL